MTQYAATTLAESLGRGWDAACAGDATERAQWRTVEGSGWGWDGEGVRLAPGAEWSALEWRLAGAAALSTLRSFAVDVRVSGDGGLGGISFGPYRDLLVPLGGGAVRELRLTIDGEGGGWAFSVDGVLANRSWWDAAIGSAADLLGGALTLKAHRGRNVRYAGLRVSLLQTSCEFSVILTCQRFLQRLRVTLRNWCQQDLPLGSYEILVVNPASPDGTHEHLEAAARAFPHVALREVAVGAGFARNKGAMINRAVQVSRGSWIWLADADCLFGPDAGAAAVPYMRRRPARLYYLQRRYLPAAQTDALLAGRLDGMRDFDALAAVDQPHGADCAPWGYTQIVPRDVLQQIRYGEDHNHYAHTDTHFVAACAKRGLLSEEIPGVFCLHLDHPFAWYGTDTFL